MQPIKGRGLIHILGSIKGRAFSTGLILEWNHVTGRCALFNVKLHFFTRKQTKKRKLLMIMLLTKECFLLEGLFLYLLMCFISWWNMTFSTCTYICIIPIYKLTLKEQTLTREFDLRKLYMYPPSLRPTDILFISSPESIMFHYLGWSFTWSTIKQVHIIMGTLSREKEYIHLTACVWSILIFIIVCAN